MNIAHRRDGARTIDWNGVAGHGWVEAQDLLDRMFAPFETLLADAAMAGSTRRLLDVGCGTGATTLAAARRLGMSADCVGIDISEPMIAAARTRAEREASSARFIRANAQDHGFEPASFDMILSRFGVMFFEDSIEAFANLRRAASDNAELRVIVWRSPEENPFMTAAERAAAPLLPAMPARDPEAPGQFAFADRDRVHGILARSGWTAIDIEPIDIGCTLPERDLLAYLTRVGPLGRILPTLDDGLRARVVEAARAAFDPYLRDGVARYDAACWMVGARSGAR